MNLSPYFIQPYGTELSIRLYGYRAGRPFETYTCELKSPGSREADIRVTYCGNCHSHLSMRTNTWGMAQFPFVSGHETPGEEFLPEKENKAFEHLVAGTPRHRIVLKVS